MARDDCARHRSRAAVRAFPNFSVHHLSLDAHLQGEFAQMYRQLFASGRKCMFIGPKHAWTYSTGKDTSTRESIGKRIVRSFKIK
eukprot:79441-Pleurochrysis_carterae.AAC.2